MCLRNALGDLKLVLGRESSWNEIKGDQRGLGVALKGMRVVSRMRALQCTQLADSETEQHTAPAWKLITLDGTYTMC